MSQIDARIRQKRDTAANWTNSNPVLLNGELIVVETSTGAIRLKVGDGVKTFNQLPFLDETLRALITDVDNNNSAVVMTKNGESQLLDTFNIVSSSGRPRKRNSCSSRAVIFIQKITELMSFYRVFKAFLFVF